MKIEDLKNVLKMCELFENEQPEQPEQSEKTNNQDLVDLAVLIRTVTFSYTGIIKSINSNFIVLSDAAWIADTGRFYDALKNNDFDEVEPFVNDVYINIGSIVDFTELVSHETPREQK